MKQVDGDRAVDEGGVGGDGGGGEGGDSGVDGGGGDVGGGGGVGGGAVGSDGGGRLGDTVEVFTVCKPWPCIKPHLIMKWSFGFIRD